MLHLKGQLQEPGLSSGSVGVLENEGVRPVKILQQSESITRMVEAKRWRLRSKKLPARRQEHKRVRPHRPPG